MPFAFKIGFLHPTLRLFGYRSGSRALAAVSALALLLYKAAALESDRAAWVRTLSEDQFHLYGKWHYPLMHLLLREAGYEDTTLLDEMQAGKGVIGECADSKLMAC